MVTRRAVGRARGEVRRETRFGEEVVRWVLTAGAEEISPGERAEREGKKSVDIRERGVNQDG